MSARDLFKIENANHPPTWNLDADGGMATLHVYGAIGGYWGEVDAQSLVPAIRDLDVATLNVHVNSPGGDVYDGIAIRNALRQHPAHVIVTVDSLAASAASFIACAGDELIMSENSELMIHDAWMIALGNADDMREAADSLDRVSDNIAAMYAAKAGGTADEWRTIMKAETWYSAAEAVAAGLADRTDTTDQDDTADEPPIAAGFNLAMFNHAGRTRAPAPPTPAALAHPREKETRMNREQLQAALNAGTITQADHDTAVAVLDRMDGRAPATPPAPSAPAEYQAGPQQPVTPAARVEDRPQSLGSIMPDLLAASGDSDMHRFVSTVNNALTTVVPSDDAGEGFLTTDRIGQVWQANPSGRPVINSLGAVRPLRGTTIEGFKWTLPTPAPESYAGDTAEVDSDAWATEKVSISPDRWAKANKIDRIYTDLGSEDLIRSLFQILDQNYEGVSDTSVFGDVHTGASALTGGATSVVEAVSKAYLQLKKIGASPSKFWIAEDLFTDFAALKVADLPAWIANATGFVHLDGKVKLDNVLDVDVNFDLSAGEFLAYDPNAATVFESPTVKLEAQDVGHGAIDIGWFAYGGVLVNDARAIVATTISAS